MADAAQIFAVSSAGLLRVRSSLLPQQIYRQQLVGIRNIGNATTITEIMPVTEITAIIKFHDIRQVTPMFLNPHRIPACGTTPVAYQSFKSLHIKSSHSFISPII
jgi:hypothetical protein